MKINPFIIQNWKTYYINLDRRNDRRERIEAELLKQGISAEKFSALTDADGWKFPNLEYGEGSAKGELGCTFSHYSILKQHLESKSEKILAIFEDDAHFSLDFKKRLKYLADNFDLEWDVFHLSAAIKIYRNRKTNVKHVYKVTDSIFCTHAMLINPKSIKRILKSIESEIKNGYSNMDGIYHRLVPYYSMYCFVPGMVSQDMNEPGDIAGGRNNITQCFITTMGQHVFIERLEDYDYRNTGFIKSLVGYAHLTLSNKFDRFIGSIGIKIKNISPKFYFFIKKFFI